MADIGRLDFGRAIRRALDLSGDYQPAMGEGVVPTVVVADLTTTPFDMAVPWSCTAVIAAVAAQVAWATIQEGVGTNLPRNSWIEINRILVNGDATGFQVWIEPMAVTAVPALGTTTDAVCNRQGGTSGALKRRMPEVTLQYGNSATVESRSGLYVAGPVSLESREIRGLWSISHGGALAVISGVVNEPLNVGFSGLVHYSTTR